MFYIKAFEENSFCYFPIVNISIGYKEFGRNTRVQNIKESYKIQNGRGKQIEQNFGI